MFFDFFKKKPKTEPQSAPEQDVVSTPDSVKEEASVIEETPSESRPNDVTDILEKSEEPEAVSSSQTQHIANPAAEEQSFEPQISASLDAINEKTSEPTHETLELSAVSPIIEPEPEPAAAPIQEKPQKLGFFARIKQGLARTSSHFAEGLGNLFLGRKTIDDELFEDLETQLLVADVGIDATTEIIDRLTARVARKQLNDVDALYQALREELKSLLLPVEQPMNMTGAQGPYVILVVGVNGVGKTTTIGKLAKRFQKEGKKVMLAAGDTFRAAAVEQLQVWGERNNVAVVAQHTGADSASVIFDALQAAKSRNIDVLIADTAGRLHNKNNLMEELAKVKRVMAKLDAQAPHEVLLVLDAGTGQNAVNQTEQFKDMAGVTGLALTKLDGTAKGGVIFALSKKFALPVRFIGVGEGIDDLQPFNAEAFVSALFDKKAD